MRRGTLILLSYFLCCSLVCGFLLNPRKIHSFPGHTSNVSKRSISTACFTPTEELYVVDDTQSCEHPVARADLINDINSTGWAYLSVDVLDTSVPRHIQAYAAGLVEGHISRDLISMHIQNTVANYCENAKEYCQRLAYFLLKNFEWMNKQIEDNSDNPYWIQVNMTLSQLVGLINGYEGDDSYVIQGSDDLQIHPIFLLQLSGDREDLEVKLNRPEYLRSRTLGSGHCSALVKILGDLDDVLTSHVTWTSYSSMLRMQKRYSFFGCANNDPGHTVVLSGYPGTLISNDDFVITSSKLAIVETTFSNYNDDLWKYVLPTTVLTWLRSSVSHRMADSGFMWAKTFRMYNSGTYNNEWIIVDYKKLERNDHNDVVGLLYLLDQLPGHVEYGDITETFMKQGYWPSYNSPYFSNIFNMSEAWKNVEKFGEWFTYDRTPRALIFARDHVKVHNMESFIKLMRSNDYQHDPLSRCNCTPPYSGENAISCRSDLNPQDGIYPFPALGFRDHGATDVKATSISLMAKMEFAAIAGPTYDPLPIFDWTTTPLRFNVSHVGQPNQFKFPTVIHKWSKVPIIC